MIYLYAFIPTLRLYLSAIKNQFNTIHRRNDMTQAELNFTNPDPAWAELEVHEGARASNRALYEYLGECPVCGRRGTAFSSDDSSELFEDPRMRRCLYNLSHGTWQISAVALERFTNHKPRVFSLDQRAYVWSARKNSWVPTRCPPRPMPLALASQRKSNDCA
jgi:hypothetical protein